MEIHYENKFNSTERINNSPFLELSKFLSLAYDVITIKIIGNEEMLEMNNKFLNHNYYTDILTFDLRDELMKDAEIYISYEMATENSLLYHCSYDEEIRRLIIHGFLHLAGYKDDNSKNKKEMRKNENLFLKTLFHVKINEK